MLSWLHEVLKEHALWTWLRAITNLPAMRSTIAIPVIGWLIIFNAKFVEWSNLQIGDHAASVSPRLLLLYTGLSFLALGSLLFTLCPAQIKKYALSTEYVGAEFDKISTYDRRQTERMLRKGALEDPHWLQALVPLQTAITNHTKGRTLDQELNAFDYSLPAEAPSELIRNYYHQVLTVNYQRLDRSKPVARVATAFCYLTGGIILSVLSCELLFIRVLPALWSHVRSLL